MVLGCGVCGGTVGEEDGVAWEDSKCFAVEIDGCWVVLLGHGGVSLTLK